MKSCLRYRKKARDLTPEARFRDGWGRLRSRLIGAVSAGSSAAVRPSGGAGVVLGLLGWRARERNGEQVLKRAPVHPVFLFPVLPCLCGSILLHGQPLGWALALAVG